MTEPILEPFFRRLRFRKILKYIKPRSRVVDIGCGHTPHFLNRLERFIKNGVGIDQLIGNSRQGKIKLISTQLSDKVPLRTSTADHITLVAVLEHLENPESILSESYRILRHHGTIIITTPTPITKPLLEFLAYGLGMVSVREIAEHKRYYWGSDIVKQLKKAGFRNITHQYFELFCNNLVVARKN